MLIARIIPGEHGGEDIHRLVVALLAAMKTQPLMLGHGNLRDFLVALAIGPFIPDFGVILRARKDLRPGIWLAYLALHGGANKSAGWIAQRHRHPDKPARNRQLSGLKK